MLLSREVSVSSDYNFEEKCVNWNSFIAGFAVWMFMITIMFLVGTVNY